VGHDYQDWLRGKGIDPHQLYADQTGAIRTGVPAALSQTAWACDRARDFIRAHADKPWFLSINVFDPHPPFDAPPEYRSRFDAQQMPAPAFRPTDIEHQIRMAAVDQQARKAVDPRHDDDERDFLEKSSADSDTADHGHDQPPERFDGQALRACYHAMIAQIDDMVGSLLGILTQTGQREDTLVLFMSDHGEMLGDHGLLYKGCRFYEGLVHVPLIVSHPGRLAKGIVADGLVELVDLAPTILELADFPVPPDMQGRSLSPLLAGRAPPDRHKAYVLSEYFDALRFPGSVGSRGSMYFDGRYKICVYHDAGLGELYDLRADPQEFVDLWDDPASQPLRLQLLERHFNAMMCVSGAGPERTADY
jgi:arylsulfatase A-like enzyme